MIIRTLNNEPLEEASSPQSKTYPLRLLVPHILIGSIIGKSGSRIREIQEASGARLNASGSCLPLSTERSLVVLGVADAVHIATYYIANTLVEQLTERFGGPAASAYATRSGGPAGPIPGGMQVVPYQPQPLHGSYGNPDTYKRHNNSAQRTPTNPYGIPYLHGPAPAPVPQAPIHYADPQAANAYSGAGPHQPGQAAPTPQQPASNPMATMLPGQPLTQQIFIPNDMVGAIIGKGGAKINEIRQLSGSVIKINEPQDNSNERLVTITGTQECNQMALYMLYSRLGMFLWSLPITNSKTNISFSLQRVRSIGSDRLTQNKQKWELMEIRGGKKVFGNGAWFFFHCFLLPYHLGIASTSSFFKLIVSYGHIYRVPFG